MDPVNSANLSGVPVLRAGADIITGPRLPPNRKQEQMMQVVIKLPIARLKITPGQITRRTKAAPIKMARIIPDKPGPDKLIIAVGGLMTLVRNITDVI
jgi:hypothetical protein